jgi:hypothetical protein
MTEPEQHIEPTAEPQLPAQLPEAEMPNTSSLTYGYSRGGAVIRPEDEGKHKGLAVRAMEEQTQMHMDQIYEQMKLLAEQAQNIQRRRELSERIYLATMRFEPLIGRIYYLYNTGNKDILSLIAPNEWGRSKGYERYLAQLRLLADHTWEVLD